ncbi:chromatin DNA-binding EKC/KEOPS complex subunit GON7 [Kluyveromyces lactis]|uniref:EKC/KEOPS complex subunit GON7 n=1 Tax=Kluyveromyces lactis (strain ATCC 8585 / CBS 2359 / DSM 70799 / NBRC 1267 / NRRL Y-1140 / WM37) TaxID=284590 RepID=GON7_KLULA|nr:uncharacterized protein KLLA0_A06171g [Kluyveromyces lactis]Q6CXR4.1 RecName: Full=EKC/KEOPS complex subunit GON7 [Kluyveromyces lactis NRRL Y-1140]CAH02863.1 KLLA0A06171p [Kluyveromyces lactis]|eukprot:XP_451275.1 uncharacterized protein KLLA0_A06171g [Kluyveromyces lactis]
MSLPHATYTGPKSTHEFEVDPSDPRYQTTEGRTTGASDYVLKQGHQDVDKPSDPKKVDNVNSKTGIDQYTTLSQLRMQLTGLQDDINEYLTEKINHVKKPRNSKQEQEINDLLDGSEET